MQLRKWEYQSYMALAIIGSMCLLDLYKAVAGLNDKDRWEVMRFWKICRTYKKINAI